MANEKRLIDFNKLIENFKVKKVIECFPDWYNFSSMTKNTVIRFARAYEEIISNQPTVDAVEVVRCKDCRHMEITPDNLRWCNAWERINGMGDDGYCNYGERRCE